ncbi:MAG: 16S rRNA (uracil(1498)-N(3))-methyltransferase [Burkholderiaceae bacterium]|nr:16S rRNA (uracil(1498)-N(3))-methyltransferase [Burkholderiaceae bacterium]
MSPRIFVEPPLGTDADLALPPGAARHAQVLRLQPGAALRLFDGDGGEWDACVTHMGRSEVRVRVGAHEAIDRELACQVTLAVGMPANERMDTLVEKATELGVATIVPLMCERSVLRLQGERAVKKLAHWRGVAIAACEQSGRTRLPALHAVTPLAAWLQALPVVASTATSAESHARWLLSLDPLVPGVGRRLAALAPGSETSVCVLSGPEGGLSPAEQALALRFGFTPVSLGPRVLRADTAPLAALACIAALIGLTA